MILIKDWSRSINIFLLIAQLYIDGSQLILKIMEDVIEIAGLFDGLQSLLIPSVEAQGYEDTDHDKDDLAYSVEHIPTELTL